MPRAGWLASGAIGAALAVGGVGAGPLPVVGTAAIACGLIALGLGFRRSSVIAVGVGVALVAVRLALGVATVGEPHRSGVLPASSAEWQGEVSTLNGTARGEQRATLLVRAASESSDAQGVSWRVYAWLPRYPPVIPGDGILFEARLEPVVPGTGFGDFLRRSDVDASARIAAFEVRPSAGHPMAQLESVRRRAADLVALAIPQPAAGLAAGILVGLRDLVDRQVAAEFATAGLSHVVAISGWNIGLIGATIAALLSSLGRRSRSLIVIAAIVVYTLVAGASASVVRAALMGGVVLLARESGRRGGAATALGLAALVMVLVEPRTASDIGFQLSVAATAGLLCWSRSLETRLRARLPRRSPGWLAEALAVSLAAQAATLPLVLLHFGRLSMVSPVANLVAAPIVAPVMLAALVALLAGAALAGGVPALLVAPAVIVASLLLGTLIAIGRVFASLPFASLEVATPLDAVAAAAVTIAILAFGTSSGRRMVRPLVARMSRHTGRTGAPAVAARHGEMRLTDPRSAGDRPVVRRTRRAVLAMVPVAALLIGLVAVTRPDGRLRMTVLDVGQGDAILLEGPRGGRMLIDGGPDPDRLLMLLDARLPAWDRRIDVLLLTHPHEDHVAGFALLLERYDVAAVAEPGMRGRGPGDAAFREMLARLRLPVSLLADPDVLSLDGARLAVVWPRAGEVPLRPADDGTAVNNVSIVLDVRYGERRFLLNGDIEEGVDPRIAWADPAGSDGAPGGGPSAGTGQRVDVLKVAHHGSGTATTPAFVATVRPRVAIVSAGTGNPYGHPDRGTMDRLVGSGSRVFRTDLDGSVTASTDGHDLIISTAGPRPVPSYRAAVPRVAGLAPGPIPGDADRFLCGVVRGPGPRSGSLGASAPSARSGAVAQTGTSTRITGSSRDGSSRPGVRRRGLVVARVDSPPIGDPRREPLGDPTRRAADAWYDRLDARPLPHRGGAPALRVRATAIVRDACLGRGRDRRVPRPRDRGAGRGGRSPPRGGRRAAARRGQAAAGGPPAEAARAR